MRKSKRVLKILAVVAALLLSAGVVYLTNEVTGCPISYFVVNHAVQQYMEETYGETDFVAGKPKRAIKLGGFIVEVHSPSSQDTHFTLHVHQDGTIWEDGYAQSVSDGSNTAMRLSREYNALCAQALADSSFPDPASCGGSLMEAVAEHHEKSDEPGVHPEPMNPLTLALDAEGDIGALSAKHGKLTLCVESEAVTVETASKSLLAIRQIMEEKQLPFHCVELWINAPEDQQAGDSPAALHILNFGWDEIREEGMLERTTAAWKATESYFQAE